jgi:hypothetical protein
MHNMKHKIIIGALSLVLSVIIFGFISKPDENIMYDYVQIKQRGKNIGVSTMRGFEVTKIEGHDDLDVTAVLSLLEEYQRNGYEVLDHSISTTPLGMEDSYLIRKKR